MPSPWERRPKESEAAYAAFLAYRDLGSGRTLEIVNRAYTGNIPATNLAKLKRWSTRYEWVERCRAWDNHLQAERDRVAAREARDLERRRLRELDEVWEDAQALRAKVRDMLKVPHLKARTDKVETSADGKTVIQYITFEPARWAFRDAAAMARAAAELASAVLHAQGKDVVEMDETELGGAAGEPGAAGDPPPTDPA